MRSVVIFGLGSFAAVMCRHFEAAGRRVAAYAVDRELLAAAPDGRPVVPFDELPARHPPEGFDLFVAIGYRRMRARRALVERLRAAGYRFASYVSPHAVVASGVPIGANAAVLDLVVVEPFATIEDNVVLCSGVVVAHECRVGAHSFVAARSTLAGRSSVGEGCFLGVACATINDVTLAPETHVLPGSVIYQDTAPMTRYLGVPARAVGTHAETGIVIERG